MINNYYTLSKLVKEFRVLEGCQVRHIFTQDKFNTIIEFDSGEEFFYLNLYQRNRESALFLNENFTRARTGTNNILKELEGDILQSISLIRNDRIFKLEFINFNLYAIIIGNSRSNFLLCNTKDNVIDSLSFQNETIGKQISELIVKKEIDLDSLESNEAILKSKYLLNNYHIKDYNLKFDNISFVDYYIASILKSQNFIYEINPKQFLFSNLALQTDFKPLYQSNNTSEVIRKYISMQSKYLDLDLERNKMLAIIDSKLKKNINIISHSNKVLSDKTRIENYRTYGSLLLSSTNLKQKGLKTIDLADWNGNHFQIELDNKLSITENANKYFEKAKKAEKEIKVIEERIPNINRIILSLNQLKEEILKVNYPKDLKVIQSQNSELFSVISKNKKESESTKYRIFSLIGGFQLFVGKNSANNEELTVKFALPNDIWLHARGIGGSHCVIRRNRNQIIPNETLTQAAEIAAYYSQMRKAQYVPVIYTEKKFVRKPKGAAIGSVTVSKEEVIMVEPKLPK